MKEVIGIGVMLQTPQNTFLFQERDSNATFNPGQIAAFGGGVEDGESIEACAIREMAEELNLQLDLIQLKSIGDFESHNKPNNYIRMFLVKGIDPSQLILQEGRSIQELSLEDALRHEKVTAFTKEVLRTLI